MTWPLVACDWTHLAPQPNIYRTTEGGERTLSWNLSVWNANKTQLLNTITENTPSGIAGGFKWQFQPNGDNVQLELSGRNDRVKLPPRGVVQLRVDNQAAFYGIVPDPPSGNSPDVEQAQVLGGREALRKVLLDGKVYRNIGVYAIVRDILSRLCPPSLTYLPGLIGDGSGTDAGPTLDTYYAPTADLVTVLDALAKSAGATWGVDAQGQVFLGRPPAAPLIVAYAGQPWRRLRVQGREAVTRAVLRVVSAPSEVEGEVTVSAYTPGTAERVPYLPATVTAIATHPQHDLYRAEATVEAPAGVSLVRESRGTAEGENITDLALAADGNDSTYATNTAAGQATFKVRPLPGERVVGARFVYSTNWQAASDDARSAILILNHYGPGGGLGAANISISAPPATEGHDLRTLQVIFPPGAHAPTVDSMATLWGLGMPAPGALRIYSVVLLVVDEEAAQKAAATFLQAPFASPAELTLSGLIPPTSSLTVTGSPDGDVSGPTSLWEYEHTPESPRTTRVRLGSDGQSDTARAIKFAVRG